MPSLLTGFKDFIMRGNVLELAVAVVIGTAFTALVNGIVEGLLNPLVALVAGSTDMTGVGEFVVDGTVFQPGLALDALLTFLLVSAAVYFFIVLPFNRLAATRAREEAAAEAASTAPDVALLQEIRDLIAAGTSPGAARTVVGAPDAPASPPAAPGDATGSGTGHPGAPTR